MSPRPAVPTPPLRVDTRRTRNHLLDVMAELMQERGLVTLPELAREAGVSVATVYRHFGDVRDAREEYSVRLVQLLISEFTALPDEGSGLDLFHRVCSAWVELAVEWARAASYMRSPRGYAQRLAEHEPNVTALDDVLRPVVQRLMKEEHISERNVDYAVLMWVTLFDERVLADLYDTLDWNAQAVANRLSATFIAAMQRLGRGA